MIMALSPVLQGAECLSSHWLVGEGRHSTPGMIRYLVPAFHLSQYVRAFLVGPGIKKCGIVSLFSNFTSSVPTGASLFGGGKWTAIHSSQNKEWFLF